MLLPTTLAAEPTTLEPPWYAIGQEDWSILVPFLVYMLGVLVIAIMAHRYQRREDFGAEYYVAGRSFGAWVLAMSWVATLASGGTFLGYPSLVHSYGWSMAFWVSGSVVTAVVGLGIVGKRINRLARQTGALTLVDLMRDRFDSHVIGLAYTAVVLVTTSVYLVAQFVAGATILESVLDTSYAMGLILFAVSVVAYTTYGGFRAVAWTDTMQGIVMIVGVVVLLPLTLWAVGGLEQATVGGDRPLAERVDRVAESRELPAERHAYLYGPGPQRIKGTAPERPDGSPRPEPWLPIGLGLSLFMIRSLGAVMMPTTVPRMLAFRDTAALRRALLLLAPYFLLVYGCSLITMNCAYSLGLELPVGRSDKAVPELIQQLKLDGIIPAVLAGLLIAAPFAAVMSTVDSALLVVSASVVRDLVEKTWIGPLPVRSTRWLGYAVTAVAGLGVCAVALSIKPAFLQPLVIHYVGGSTSALFWPGIATLFWRRATVAGVTGGLLGGGLVYIACVAWPPLSGAWEVHPFAFGFVASGACVLVVSRLTRRQSPEELDGYFGREDVAASEDRQARPEGEAPAGTRSA